MKRKTTLFKTTFLLLIGLLPAQFMAQYNLDYAGGAGVNGGTPATVNLTNLSTCQTAATIDATADVYNGVSWSSGSFTLTVNGTNIGSFSSPQTAIDLSAYMPISTVQVTSNAGTWHTTNATLHLTCNSGNAAPGVANVFYPVGGAASPLTATLSGTGTTLNWYTSANGGGHTTTAPTPSTASVGITNYWVSQTDASGCESPRVQMSVYVGYEQLPYHSSAGEIGGQTASTTINNLSSCQHQVILTSFGSVFTGSSWYDGTYNVIVNGSSIGSYTGLQTIDLTSYIPVTSIQLTENAGTWHIVDAAVKVISLSSNMPANGPGVTDLEYCQNATAAQLTATLNSTGSSLVWYSTANGDGSNTTAPTPSTSTAGTTSYFVAQKDAGGCESVRSELEVTVLPSATGTDIQSACNSYTWINGINYTSSNSSATHTIAGGAANGCDSIVTLNLTIITPSTGTDVQTACSSFDWIDGNQYTASNTTATHTIVGGAASGCDSIVTLNLTILTPTTGTDVQMACNAYTWIDGNEYTASNTSATHTIVGGAANGCDSIVTLNLTIENTPTITLTDNGNGTITATGGSTYVWWDCTANQEISGVTGATFTPTQDGSYAAISDNGTNCADTSDCMDIVLTSGISELSTIQFDVYPNPTKGNVTIQFINETAKLQITDAQGKLIYVDQVANGTSVNLEAYEKGVYFFMLSTNHGNTVKRVVKD